MPGAITAEREREGGRGVWKGGGANLGEPASVFEPRVACGSQGERSSGLAGKDNAMTPKIALGRPMLCGLRMEEDSLLTSDALLWSMTKSGISIGQAMGPPLHRKLQVRF